MSNKASFHAQRVNHIFSLLHNTRDVEPDYLITDKNSIYKSYNEISLLELQSKIEEDYEKHTKQKYQKQFSSIMEAVINIKENTTLEDVDRLKRVLEQRFGIEVVNAALHLDEGFFSVVDDLGNEYSVDRKDNLKYRNIPDGESIEIKINFDGEEKTVNGKLKRNFNYHAHLVYSKFDFEEHKHIKLSREDMRDIQTITAECLGMERGLKGSKQKRLNHYDYSKLKHEQMNTTKFIEIDGEKLKMGDVKNFFKSNREVMISLGNQTQQDYMFMKKSELEILEKVKDKTITTPSQLNEYIKRNTQLTYELQKLKLEKKELEEKKEELYRGGKFLKEKNTELKKEIEELKGNIKQVVEVNKTLIQQNKSLQLEVNKKEENDMFNTFVKPKQEERESYERER